MAESETAPDSLARPLVLAIDIGSSSARTGVFDSTLTPVDGTFCQDTYSIQTGHDGRAELDPEYLFDVVVRCIDRSLAAGCQIDAVGVSCFWHSIMGVEQDNTPTTAVLTWADTRAASTVATLKREAPEDDHHQRTGTRFHSSYPVAKIRWFVETNPDIVERTAYWLSFPEYLQRRLTGRRAVSISMASGTGLFDRISLTWSAPACALARVDPEQLSPIDDAPAPALHDRFASRWPSLSGAIWLPSIGDGAANNLGSDGIDASHPSLMIGTTGALRLLTDAPPPDELPAGLWQYRLDRHRALLGGALSEGGGVLGWHFRNLRLPEDEKLDATLREIPPDGHGLTILPYFAGERSPGWNSEALGTIHGLRFDTTAVEIVRATMETIAYSFASILDDLKPLLEEPVEIIATGNGLRKNPAWVQILADVLGYPLLLPRQTESSLRGAALHALMELGIAVPDHTFSASARRFEPNEEHADTYRHARERNRALYRQMVDPNASQ